MWIVFERSTPVTGVLRLFYCKKHCDNQRKGARHYDRIAFAPVISQKRQKKGMCDYEATVVTAGIL